MVELLKRPEEVPLEFELPVIYVSSRFCPQLATCPDTLLFNEMRILTFLRRISRVRTESYQL